MTQTKEGHLLDFNQVVNYLLYEKQKGHAHQKFFIEILSFVHKNNVNPFFISSGFWLPPKILKLFI